MLGLCDPRTGYSLDSTTETFPGTCRGMWLQPAGLQAGRARKLSPWGLKPASLSSTVAQRLLLLPSFPPPSSRLSTPIPTEGKDSKELSAEELSQNLPGSLPIPG